MLYFMMLLEQCSHIVIKYLATVKYIDEDQIRVRLVMWLDYSFDST